MGFKGSGPCLRQANPGPCARVDGALSKMNKTGLLKNFQVLTQDRVTERQSITDDAEFHFPCPGQKRADA
nr:hypothetical protein GCM10017547_19810 [Pseudarthrobacter oxydans]BFE45360.1 hypothetical protein GCM10017547_32530 [Pseudarthrobacter oxydans]